LKAARQAYSGPIVAIVQPHRYSRLRDTFEQFSTCLHDSDTAIVAPVYAAGEQPLPGFDRDSFADSLRAHGHRHVLIIDGPDDLPPLLADLAKPDGAIVFLGAGSITHWAAGLQSALSQMEART
jgi:UDP-N-acetylmuramate--alanine ligase